MYSETYDQYTSNIFPGDTVCQISSRESRQDIRCQISSQESRDIHPIIYSNRSRSDDPDKMIFPFTGLEYVHCAQYNNLPMSSTENFDDTNPFKSFCKPYQNSKRCGVIFVDSRENEVGNMVYSFIVVRGKESGIHSFPKGRVSTETESEEDCAIREVYEETGIVLTSVHILPRIVLGRNVYFIYHTSKEHFSTFEVHDTDEVAETGWKTTDELSKLVCNKDLRSVLRYPTQRQLFHRIIYKTIYQYDKYPDIYRPSHNTSIVNDPCTA